MQGPPCRGVENRTPDEVCSAQVRADSAALHLGHGRLGEPGSPRGRGLGETPFRAVARGGAPSPTRLARAHRSGVHGRRRPGRQPGHPSAGREKAGRADQRMRRDDMVHPRAAACLALLRQFLTARSIIRLLREVAAVGHDASSRDVARRIRRQEQDGRRDFVRLCNSVQRDLRQEGVED